MKTPRLPVGPSSACAVMLLCVLGSAFAQQFHGTFSAMGRYGLVELVLRQDGARVKGVLTGNDLSFDLVGEVAADDPGFAYGTISAPDLEQSFEAYTDGQHMELYVIGRLPDGTDDWDNVSLLEFDFAGEPGEARSVAKPPVSTSESAPAAAQPVSTPESAPAAAPPPAAASNPLAANPLAANPLAANPLASDGPFAGTWSDGELKLELQAQGAGYIGWLDFQGARYPVKASSEGQSLTGTFNAGGVDYPFVATLSAGSLTLESDGARYELLPSGEAAGPEASPAAEAVAVPSAPVAPAGSAASTPIVIASGAYGQLTEDGALAFAEALRFILAQLGDTQALAGVSDSQIVDALASGFPSLEPESQQSLANARQIWEQTRQSWTYSDLATQKEFALAVLTVAYGEEAARSALGMSGGSGGGAGGGPVGMPTADPYVQEQTNNATGCWAAAGCGGYDPVGGFTYDSPDGY